MYNFLVIKKYSEGIPQQYLIRTLTILQQCFPIFVTTPIEIQNDTVKLKGTWYLMFLCKRIIGCALVQDKLLCNVCIFPTFQNKGYGGHLIEFITEGKKNLSVYVDDDEDYEKRTRFYKQFNLTIKSS